MNQKSDFILAAIGGPILGVATIWCSATEAPFLVDAVNKVPINHSWVWIAIFLTAWWLIGCLPSGIVAACFDEGDDPETIFKLVSIAWMIGTAMLAGAFFASCFAMDVFKISGGAMLIGWMLGMILITLIVIAFRIGGSQRHQA